MKKVLKEILSTSVYFLVVLLVTYLIVCYVGQRTEVVGSSMENTLSDGDNLIVDKLTYRFQEPERFDIIVFPYRHDEEVFYIKRIIGMPGETVRINAEGQIFINEKELSENYGRQVIENPGIAIEGITLGKDEYFVLGDNRNNSMDSRSEEVGNIYRKDILGRAWVRIWPLDEMGFLKHQ